MESVNDKVRMLVHTRTAGQFAFLTNRGSAEDFVFAFLTNRGSAEDFVEAWGNVSNQTIGFRGSIVDPDQNKVRTEFLRDEIVAVDIIDLNNL